MKRASLITIPNLFDHATKELSQDAMICWLLARAGTKRSEVVRKPKNSALRDIGIAFVHSMVPALAPQNEFSIVVARQVKRIDILAVVNRKHVLVIEDTIDSMESGSQLMRYKQAIASKDVFDTFGRFDAGDENVHFFYIKTGNLSRVEEHHVQAQGYAVKDRANLLNVLNTYPGRNVILLDYRSHLQKWEDDTQGYRQWTEKYQKSKKSIEGSIGLSRTNF